MAISEVCLEPEWVNKVVSWAGLTMEKGPVLRPTDANWLVEWSAGQVWPWRKGQCWGQLTPTDCLSGQLSRFDHGERASAEANWCLLTAWVVSWAGLTMEKGPVLRPTDAYWLPEWSAEQVWPWRKGQCWGQLMPTDCLSGQLSRFDHGERASAEANWCLLTAWVVSWAGLTMEKGPVLSPTDTYWLPEWSAEQVWPWRKGQCWGQLMPTDCLSGQLSRFDHGERASAESNWYLLTAWVVSWAGLTMEKGPVLSPTDTYWLPEWSAEQVWPWRKGQCWGQLMPTDCLSGQLSRFDHGERASAEANWCLLTAWVVSWAGLTMEKGPVLRPTDAYWLPEWSAEQVWPWRKGQCWGQLMPTDCLSGQLSRFDHGE